MIRDLVYAVRRMKKAPGFTAVILFSLALGVGASATVLCWLRQIVYFPLKGVQDQGNLVVLVSNQGGGSVSLPDLRDFEKLPSLFDGAVATMSTPVCLTLDRAQEMVDGEIVSAHYFELMGVKPILGRTFLPGEDRNPGGDTLAVISENLWRRRFAADPAVIGRVIDLNRHSFTIIGVAPRSFQGSQSIFAYDLWVPLSMISEIRNQERTFLTSRSARGWHNIARLHPGTSLAAAQAAIDTFHRKLIEDYPNSNRDITYRVLPLSQCPWGAQTVMGPSLKLLLAVSLGVLLLVAANVTNLLLAQTANRQKELAIRLSSGASKSRVAWQLLTENLFLALLGTMVGLGLAQMMVNLMPRFFPTVLVTRVSLAFELDSITVAFSLLLTLFTWLLCGGIPAWYGSHPELCRSLKQSGTFHHTSPAFTRLRNGLVITEVALALMLLVGAGLCYQGLQEARRMDPGFRSEKVLLAGLRIGMNGYEEENGKSFYRRLQQRLSTLPGVEEAALASWFPLGLAGCKGTRVEVEGYQHPLRERVTYEYARVSPRYFAVMGIPLLAGRDFSEADDRQSSRVAIVNEHFARRFWPGQDPIGHRFRAGRDWCTVVGLAKAGKYNRLSEGPWPFFYLPYQQGVPDLDLDLCIRTQGDPEAMISLVRRTLQELDPGVQMLQALPLSVHTQFVLIPEVFASRLLTLLGIVALCLAAMGVHAVMAYGVSRRIQEFGIRMALGADCRNIYRLVFTQGLRLIAAGALVGLALAMMLSRMLHSFLYGVSPFDPLIFLSVTAILILVALLACWFPARQATRVDPLRALKTE